MESQAGTTSAVVDTPAINRGSSEAEPVPMRTGARQSGGLRGTKNKVWIDLDNSPHVPLYSERVIRSERVLLCSRLAICTRFANC